MSQEKVLLLGYGDIAKRLTPLLDDYHITGVKRSPLSTSVKDTKITIKFADCRQQESMQAVMDENFDIIVMTFTPTSRSDEGYREGYVDTTETVLNILNQQSYKPRLIIFVSSTSVYAQTTGDWVDENSPTEPTNYSGQRLLQAEQLLANSGFNYCCVRFSGIYGPGRGRLVQQVIAGDRSPATPVAYSNRIHADDCAGVLAHIIEQHKTHSIDNSYIATDCLPVAIGEVKQWIADQLKLPEAPPSEQSPRLSRGSKRCSNKRLLGTGYQFRYPSFREGYTEFLQNEGFYD